jgi:chemotaxis protein CheD
MIVGMIATSGLALAAQARAPGQAYPGGQAHADLRRYAVQAGKSISIRSFKEIIREHAGIRGEYIKASEGGVYLEPTLVQTVLGSCLGGVFHVPSRGVGAFFHAFLPRAADYPATGDQPVYKFVDTAFEHVMLSLRRLGVPAASVDVSLVGGANSLTDERGGVGAKNVEAAFEALERFSVRPKFTDVGGEKGRRVFFLSSSGELYINRLKGFTQQLCGVGRL